MKEYRGSDGGRYTYIDDFLNLQNLALSYSAMFDGCDNFIISGCNASADNSKITEGYCYINKKIRFLPETSLAALNYPSSSFFIVEKNEMVNTAYVDGVTRLGRYDYSCQLTPTRPSDNRGYIEFKNVGTRRINDSLFGKYALIKNSPSTPQVVSGKVTFENDVVFSSLTAKDLRLSNNNKDFGLSINSTGYSLSSVAHKSGLSYNITDGFTLAGNNQMLMNLSNEKLLTVNSIKTVDVSVGNIKVAGNKIYEYSTPDSASLEINTVGYNGGNTKFRDFIIGDGKNSHLFIISGESKEIAVMGSMKVHNNESLGLELKHSSKSFNDNDFQKVINWKDNSNSIVGSVGYNSVADNIFRIINSNRGIEIVGSLLEVKCAIKENGSLLSDKYVQKSIYTTDLNLKANANDVYKKTHIDDNFAKITSGLSPFVQSLITNETNESSAKNTIREQIGACNLENDIHPYFLRIDGKFNVNKTLSPAQKTSFCNEIGVLEAENAQGKLTDTGWKLIRTGDGSSLYGRQFGPMVCIQGILKIQKDGFEYNFASLGIAPPGYDVGFTSMNPGAANADGVRLLITAGQSVIKVSHQHKYEGVIVSVSFSYMV